MDNDQPFSLQHKVAAETQPVPSPETELYDEQLDDLEPWLLEASDAVEVDVTPEGIAIRHAARERAKERNALHLTLRQQMAEIEKLAETDPEGADAALRAMGRAREAREAASPPEFYSNADVLADLELLDANADEPLAHPVEPKFDPATSPEVVEKPEPLDDGIEGRPIQRQDREVSGAIDLEPGPRASTEVIDDSDELEAAPEGAMCDEVDRGKVDVVNESDIEHSKPVPELPATTITTPFTPEIPAGATTELRKPDPTMGGADFFDKVPLRSTIRKAGRFLPNCFGSEFLRDPASTDCGPCEFSESCKETIVAEMPLLKVEGTARKAHFERTGRYELPPIDPERIDFLRRLLRTHYLKHYRKAQTKRRAKDRIYQRDKRGNPNARVLIEEESRERLSALRSAILRHGDDKSLQQFRGREYTIVAVWEAAQYAYLEHGPDAPARAVAAAFNDMVGPDILSRHQVRSRLDHFRKFEQSPLIWKRFVEAPDNESA